MFGQLHFYTWFRWVQTTVETSHLSLRARSTNLVLIRAGKRGGAASHLEVPSPEAGKPPQCSLEQPQAFWAIPSRHAVTPTSLGKAKRGTALLRLFCQVPFTLGSHSCLPDIKDPNTHFDLLAPSHPIFVRCCAKHLPELSPFILMTLRLRVIGE